MGYRVCSCSRAPRLQRADEDDQRNNESDSSAGAATGATSGSGGSGPPPGAANVAAGLASLSISAVPPTGGDRKSVRKDSAAASGAASRRQASGNGAQYNARQCLVVDSPYEYSDNNSFAVMPSSGLDDTVQKVRGAHRRVAIAFPEALTRVCACVRAAHG